MDWEKYVRQNLLDCIRRYQFNKDEIKSLRDLDIACGGLFQEKDRSYFEVFSSVDLVRAENKIRKARYRIEYHTGLGEMFGKKKCQWLCLLSVLRIFDDFVFLGGDRHFKISSSMINFILSLGKIKNPELGGLKIIGGSIYPVQYTCDRTHHYSLAILAAVGFLSLVEEGSPYLYELNDNIYKCGRSGMFDFF